MSDNVKPVNGENNEKSFKKAPFKKKPFVKKGFKKPNANPDVVSRKDNIKEALDILYEKFPNSIIKEGALKPLKVGFFADMKDRLPDGMSLSKLRAALRYYTSREDYLRSVVAGAHRVDVDGNEIEGDVVTEQHEQYAKEKIDEVLAKRQEIAEKKAKMEKERTERRQKKFAGKKPFNKRQFDKNRNFNQQEDFVKANIEDLKVGLKVKVKVGNWPVQGTITEILKQDMVRVFLKSGSTIDAPVNNISVPKN